MTRWVLHRALDIREGACSGHYKLRHVCPSQVTEAARVVGAVAWKQNKENEGSIPLLNKTMALFKRVLTQP